MCIDFHQTGSVDEDSDHLQLIKFWPSCAPGKGVCGGANFFFDSALLRPASSVCVSPSDFFIYLKTLSVKSSNRLISVKTVRLTLSGDAMYVTESKGC